MSDSTRAYDELLRAIRTTRRRWRLKILLRGLAIVLAIGFAAFAVSVWAMDSFHYSDHVVAVIRILIWVGLAALCVRFLVLPLARRVTDRQVALYIEENEPSLEAEVLSAIELGSRARAGSEERQPDDRTSVSDRLLIKLLEQAIVSCQALDWGASIERSGLRRFSALAAGAALVALMLTLLSPAFLQHGALLLFLPWKSASFANPYGVEVSPGNVTVARGSDQEVRARLVGFESDAVEVALRRGTGSWERWPMSPDEELGDQVFMVLDLQQQAEYFVEAEGVRSGLYRIAVAELPYVERLALEYRYPGYTGLSPRRVEDGGDIAAVRGTEVLFEVIPTVPVPAGRLVLEGDSGGEEATALEIGEEGRLTGLLRLDRDTFYRIDLRGPDGSMIAASPEYAIEVLEDQPPVVSFTTPGRDVRAHKLEEVFTEVKVEDDYGVSRVELRYSVNGEEEQGVVLLGGSRRPKQIELGHTFYLEELGLQDGDFISYYARATDADAVSDSKSVATDIYFLEISPFTKNYRQAQQGMSMSGGQQMDSALSRRQRQIIAATFKLVRDREEYANKEYDENLTTVALMQGRLAEQVQTLSWRMKNRLRGEEDFQSIVDNLERAAGEMEPAEELLSEKKPDAALAPEQRALKFLQRAEATFRDVQVSFQQGGMGGEAQRMAEDLADLFELELDKLHNQYETVQRGQRQALQEEVDEALQRLEELARRQQQENERARRLASQMGLSGAAGRNQKDLVEETEELARRLERLARERSRPDLRQTSRRLQQAADAMRRAMADRSAGEIGQGTEALEQLRRARRLLEKNREFQIASEMSDLQERAEQARRMQEEIHSEVGGLEAQGDRGAFLDSVEELMEKKDELGREVAQLESQIDRTARQARGTQTEASRRLGEASESIRENQLKEKIRYSKGVVRGRSPEYAERFEEEIASDLEEIGQRLAAAGEALGGSEENRRENALQGTRDLVRRLESFEEHVQDRGAARAAREGGGEDAGQSGREQGREPSRSARSAQQGEGEAPGEGEAERRLAEAQGGEESGRGRSASRAGEAQRGGSTSRLGQAWGGWYQPGIFTAEDLRQMAGEFDRRLQEAEQLRQELRELGMQTQELEDVLRRMREFSVRGINRDPLALEELRAQIIEGLRQFEYRLWRDLEDGGEERLYLAGADEVPDGFRELVEEYYRKLAERR